jgi:predicted ester cyclase
MSTEENKMLVHRFFEELMNQRNLALADDLFAPEYVHHFPDEDIHGPDGVKQMDKGLLTTFPDWHISTDDVIAEGDKVVVRFTIHGTHEGEGFNISPTGKRVVYTGIDIFRIADGKIVEQWTEVDALGLLQQLGVVPTMG